MEDQLHFYERERNDTYTFTTGRGILFRDDEKLNHLKSTYGKAFKFSIEIANAHHPEPTRAEIMKVITNSVKHMDRDGRWCSHTTSNNSAITNPSGANPAATKKPYFKHYCWSHGPNTSHSPHLWLLDPINNPTMECRAKNLPSGHRNDATVQDKKGGKVKPWAKGDTLGP